MIWIDVGMNTIKFRAKELWMMFYIIMSVNLICVLLDMLIWHFRIYTNCIILDFCYKCVIFHDFYNGRLKKVELLLLFEIIA